MSPAGPIRTVVRAPAWVEREYGREKWPAIERRIEEVCRREPARASLARVLHGVARSQWANRDPLALGDHVVGGRVVRVPAQAAWGAQRHLVVEAVLGACSERTDLVVDLGSGWGWYLLSVWLAGGPQHATYVAAEYTESGRRAAARLAGLDPALRFRSVPFDYHAPRLEGLGRAREAVVFTLHSAEQVPRLDPLVFPMIRGLGARVTCLHFEPVGWQLQREDSGVSTRGYAERNDYNRDLLERVRQEEAAGRIAVDAVLPNVVGINPRHAITAIRWVSVQDGAV